MKFKDLWVKPSTEDQESTTDAREPAAPASAQGEARSSSAGWPAAGPQGGKPPEPVQPAVGTPGDPARFLKQLEEALERANLPSHQDYLEFCKALSNMASLPMDESTKFKAAFATLQSLGCNLPELLESIEFYSGILDGEQEKFSEALEAAVRESAGEKETTLAELASENSRDAEEIQRLTARISANQQTISRLQGEVAQVKGRLAQRKADFTSAYTTMKERLQADARKIRTYLTS